MSLRGSPIRRLQLLNKQSASDILSLSAQIERLTSQVHLKNIEIKELYDENSSMRLTYEQQISSYLKTIGILEQKLKQVEVSRRAQFQIIKQKYDVLAAQENQNIKSYHSHQIEFLMREIAHLRVDCGARDEKINIKQKQIISMTQSYERELEQKINQINNLNRVLLSIEDTKNREIKQISTKRQLQKSRTSGVLSSRKQNNQFIDKQIRKLNEQVLQKAIKIENLSRQVNRTKRKGEQLQKQLNKKIQNLIIEKQEQSKQREEHFAKIEKSLKEQILQFKSKQVKYLGQIDIFKSNIDICKSQIKRFEQINSSKDEEINAYKDLLNKQRQDHAKEISNLMKQKKRRSSNLGSSRSLSSSLKDAGGIGNEQAVVTPQVSGIKRADSIRLATVKQQSPDKSLNRSLDRSNITQEQLQEQSQLLKVIQHYDAMIQELKRSHYSQLELQKHKNNKLRKALDQKQQELLDMLRGFSPLVAIHSGNKSLEQDRKQRIHNHWKADVALLQIMLDKYKIKAYE